MRSDDDSWYDGFDRPSAVPGDDAARPELLKWCCMEGETDGYIDREDWYGGWTSDDEPPEGVFGPLPAKLYVDEDVPPWEGHVPGTWE